MSDPVTPDVLRARAKKLFHRDSRDWAATGSDLALLDVPLHPPTERAVLANMEVARAWVEQWHRAGKSADVELAWVRRSWARVGSQEVPVRATIRGADAIARVAGEAPAWRLLTERLNALREIAGPRAVDVLRGNARTITMLDSGDFTRLVEVLGWLRENPGSGRRVRELPIRGIHTKWIEVRRGLVESLHCAATGSRGLGLLDPVPLVRMRILDPALALAGLTDVSAPVDDLAVLPLRPRRVYVFENLATVLAMPDVPGAVVLHGGGHRVNLVAHLPWAHTVTYWGDLDSHGFAILHHLRSMGVDATSVLMDTDTLLHHIDLWGEDPDPNTGVLGLLTPQEHDALTTLSVRGNVRLEQERIPWGYALTALEVG